MAYPVASTIVSEAAASSITGEMPSQLTNDAIYFVVVYDGTITWPAVTGYTKVADNPNSQIDIQVYRKIATSDSEADPICNTGVSGQYIATVLVVRDVDTVNPEDTADIQADSFVSSQQVTSTFTTAGDHRLVLMFQGQDGARNQTLPSAGMFIQSKEEGNNDLSAISGWQYYESPVTTTPFTVESSNTARSTILTIPLKSNAEIAPPYFGGLPFTMVNPLTLGQTDFGALVDDSVVLGPTWDDGHSYLFDALQEGSSVKFRSNGRFTRADSGTYNGKLIGGSITITSVDLTGKYITCNLSTDAQYAKLSSAAVGGIYFGLRSNSGTSYRIWLIAATDTTPDGIAQMNFSIDPDDTGFIHEVGTWDTTDVDGAFCGIFRNSAETRASFSKIMIANDIVIIGGSVTVPGKFSTSLDIIDGWETLTVLEQIQGQLLSFQPMVIGNGGTTTTCFSDSGGNVQFPEVAVEAERKLQFRVSANVVGLKLDLGSSDKCTVRDYAIGGISEWQLEFDIIAGAAVDLAGTIFSNANVIFTSVDNEISGVIFRGCKTLPSGANLSVNNIVDASKDTNGTTITDSTESALQTKLSNLPRTITNNTVGIRIEYTGTGDIALVGPSLQSFDGNTTDIHYDSVNVSTLTFTPGTGADIPTTSDSGNGTIVVDSSAAITLIAANIISGSYFLIINQTQDPNTALFEGTVGGSGISVSTTVGSGLDIEVGDTLELRVGFHSGTTYKFPISSLIEANPVSNVWLDTQVPWVVVESYGLDGSDFTGLFSADFVQDDVDISLAPNWSGASFVAWWGYLMGTSQALLEFFGGFTFIDAANARNNASILPILFDNQLNTESVQSDTIRIFRDDSVRPVRKPSTGGGGIDMNWMNVVYLQTTGSGPLTAGQEIELTTAAAQSTIAATQSTIAADSSVITEPQIDELHVAEGLNASKRNTFQDDGSAITNDDFTRTKSDNGDGSFDVIKT